MFFKAVLSVSVLAVAIGGLAWGGSASGAPGALGKPDTATGSPVTLGVISDAGSGAVGTGPLVEQGAKMAVAYANAYLGGMAGHKIVLFICENDESPAGGQACANQMVQKGVVAVAVPFTGQGATEVPTITGAGIPYVTLSGASIAELTTPGAFDLEGGFPAALGAIALQAKAKGFKKVALLVSNVPAAIQGAQALGGLAFKAAGIGYQVIPANPGTADLTPQLQAAASGGASAVGIVGDVTLCGSFLKAYVTLGLKLPRYVLSTCLDPSIIKSSLDKVLKGSLIAAGGNISAKDRALYAAITRKYAPSVNPNPRTSTNQESGLVPVLSLLAAMKGYSGPVTAATVRTQLQTATNVSIPYSGGLTYTCDGTAISLLKSVCSAKAILGVVGNGSNIVDSKLYNPTKLFG